MEVKPIPKPRSIIGERPVPAPRTQLHLPKSPVPDNIGRSQSPGSESLKSERSSFDERKSLNSSSSSCGETKQSTNSEFFKNLGSSSRQLKDEISEKMTVKGKALISSTRNASIRLEKSVKNLVTRRLTSSLSTDENQDSQLDRKLAKEQQEDRCVSMPVYNDIFSTLSFYSPLETSNLKSMKNEEDLSSGSRYSPPPPVYPPPPLPDETIYDELQSVTSGHSSRYDTLSSISVSEERAFERDFPDAETFDLLDFANNRRASDSDQSLNLSDVNVVASGPRAENSPRDDAKRLSRSDSWTFYDTIPARVANNESSADDHDGISSVEEENEPEAPIKERISCASNISQLSLQNSLYENWMPRRSSPGLDDSRDSEVGDVERKQSKSLLFEFDPYAKTEDNIYGNYENNDLMLLEALLATSETPSSGGSMADLREDEDDEEERDEEEIVKKELPKKSPPEVVQIKPPLPPKRYDSLPKNEYDEVEMVEQPDKSVSSKSPALLPKLAHLKGRKQPAVPPRKNSSSVPTSDKKVSEKNSNPEEAASSNVSPVGKSEERRTSVMQRLKKLGHDSTAHVKPNVINFMKNSKLLSRNREQSNDASSKKQTVKNSHMKRPEYEGQMHPVFHRGIVCRSGVGIERAKDLVVRAAVLADQKISFYTDKSMNTLKEVINLATATSIHLLQDVKTIDGETVHCIAVGCEGRPAIHVFYAKGITERRIWAQRILEALTPVFPIKYTADLTRVGWAYLKEGVTGAWFPAWLLLQQRTLVYTKSLDLVELEHVDLRKARYILLREQEGPFSETGSIPVVVVDTGGSGAIHIAAPGTREGPAWRHALHQAATSCGPGLDEQQLTQDNVPVVIDKCINFIYAHGIMSEGIYRRSGSSSAVVKLLEAFRRDAWATQITRGSYSEHDVATALRRFLRDLPAPLLPSTIHDPLCRATDVTSEEERATTYRNLLANLEPVSSSTLRRILAHLHCLGQQSARNLMTVENISAVWGPTLMHAGEKSAEDWNRSETKVVGDLIKLYPKLYQLSADDLAKEARMLEVLERHHVSNSGLRGAPSGDLKIWIYLISKDGQCVNVTIGPQKTASDVCRELAEKAKLPAHELCLEEYTLGGSLERPLHHSEKVLEAVARWGYWDPDDRKDNILILKKDILYRDIAPRIKPPMTISGELKFADTKTKHFKSYLFEFSQAKLCCYKDKVCSVKLHEWKIEDIVWYLGHEPKRNPQMGWAITFIDKNKKPARCKDSPFFGYTLAGASVVDQYKWLAAMIFGEYQMDLRPSVVNLMDP
ncbi:uncharacterized protein RhoGAP15B [Venturia canescens]|uniref:uncharacterized protein RhoGAP15B n=1 Tax=Venturia canescens TaxID=32260 RepID=UPI001C9D632A|nr:uncharacterized protein LOC122417581 [Venturia canescens]XP_043287125.1 uncharacterized protein LOC122417581 [Venturia canescens]XP_043287126.1 uncharacterized protein LOC122417581 [Venturia canescens]XP_043287127.1 uncharacterized protein LOC122417581 [Venturia canescens]